MHRKLTTILFFRADFWIVVLGNGATIERFVVNGEETNRLLPL